MSLVATHRALGQDISDPPFLEDRPPQWPEEDLVVREARLQDQPSVAPRPSIQPDVDAPESEIDTEQPQAPLSPTPADGRRTPLASNRATGLQGQLRLATDGGSLLGKSLSVLGVGIQRRTPIVTGTRSRGDRVGKLAADGSYWVPARIDLDTVLSKLDSRNIEQATIIKGPYSSLYGPGFNFTDIDLVDAPQFEDGWQMQGASGFDYQTNGQQWHGRQSVEGGDEQWGFRADYNHRTGVDYSSGAGTRIPSGFHSRELLLALGGDLSPESHLDFHYLRLDQTDVEFPGQAFDIDFLVTDAFDLTYVWEGSRYADEILLDVWYNRTRFEGNAQGAGKRMQFPPFDFLDLTAFTDVDSMSTGFRAAMAWGDRVQGPSTMAGVDLRNIRQELNEIASGRIGFVPFENANSPIPRSNWANPGLFLESTAPLTDKLTTTVGARLDFVDTEVIEDAEKLDELGILQPQLSLAEILGTSRFDQNFTLAMAFLSADYEINDCWTLRSGAGYAERAPSLTELYVAQSFLFLLQNGLNIATGDPRLKKEKLWQVDVGLEMDMCGLRGGVGVYHAWINDYITFENLRSDAEQVDLKYVNTDLATLAGVEAHCEYDMQNWLTGFATVQYVAGRDHTRDGDFATRPATPGMPSERVPGLPRGAFSGVAASAEEPLPSIPPLESRLGLRVHQAADEPQWNVELSARVVDNQDRVAASLLETNTPGFSIWDLRATWRPTERLLVLAGVENIFDKLYREHLDFRSLDGGLAVYRPGVSFYCGSELNY